MRLLFLGFSFSSNLWNYRDGSSCINFHWQCFPFNLHWNFNRWSSSWCRELQVVTDSESVFVVSLVWTVFVCWLLTGWFNPVGLGWLIWICKLEQYVLASHTHASLNLQSLTVWLDFPNLEQVVGSWAIRCFGRKCNFLMTCSWLITKRAFFAAASIAKACSIARDRVRSLSETNKLFVCHRQNGHRELHRGKQQMHSLWQDFGEQLHSLH